VLYVYQGDWPRNATRVRKQTRALAEAGHTVRLLAGNPNDKPRREVVEWMDVERVSVLGPPALSRYLAFPIFANPFWVWEIWRTARRFHADCLIVRDLPLAPAALAVASLLGVPVHYEMADVYPVAMRANRGDPATPQRRSCWTASSCGAHRPCSSFPQNPESAAYHSEPHPSQR